MKSVQCMGKTRSVCMGNPVGHMQVRPLGSLWDRSVTLQFVPERPTGHYEQYQTARVIMGPVGCNGHKQGWGGGITSSSSSIYIIATRFITRWFRAHWDCMLWGESTFTPSHFQRRAPPFTCMYKWRSREIPVGKEGARSVVHLYRSVLY